MRPVLSFSPLPLFVQPLSAGFPSPASDYLHEQLDLNQYLIRNKTGSFLFTVKGDSMLGACIQENDKVVVDRSLSAQHGDIVVAVVEGGYTLKRLYKKHGVVELHPENPKYTPMRFKNQECLQIWGVVVGVVRRYGAQG